MSKRHLYVMNKAHLMCGLLSDKRTWTPVLRDVTCDKCLEAHRVAKSLAGHAVRRAFREIEKRAPTTGAPIVFETLDDRLAFVASVIEEMNRNT